MLPNDPVTAVTPDVVAWRQHIHMNPELGFREHETRGFREPRRGVGASGGAGDLV